MVEKKKDDSIQLVRIGQARKEEKGFKTSVLGLKGKGLKNTKLSFDD